MPDHSTNTLPLIVTLVAALFSLTISLVIPAGYYLYTYRAIEGELFSETQATANMLAREMRKVQLSEPEHIELVRELLSEDLTETGFEESRLFIDPHGHVIKINETRLAEPVLIREQPVMVNNQDVGHILISRSLVDLVEKSLLIAIMAMSLGVGLFYILRTLPARALARTMAELVDERTRATTTLSSIGDAVISVSRDGIINYLNQSAERLTGYTLHNAENRHLSKILNLTVDEHQNPDLKDVPDIWSHLLKGVHGNETIVGTLRSCDGADHVVECRLATLVNSHDSGWVVVIHDITARHEAEMRLNQAARYDSLTMLPNRFMFKERLQLAMTRAHRHERLVALFYLDLDRFKSINDTLGHAAGDQLLVQVAERIHGRLRDSDIISRNIPHGFGETETVSRLGGDEFSIILENISHINQIILVAQRLLETLREPFPIEGQELHVSASIGITIYPFDDTDMNGLIKNADTAMYTAKENGRDNFQFFSSDMNMKLAQRLMMEAKLRKGLEQARFEVFLQPKSGLDEVSISGYEALLRFRDEDGSLISPVEFVPLLEESGLIIPVGSWVIDKVCAQLMEWQLGGKTMHPISVNLSIRQLAQDNFTAIVADALARHQVDSGLLELEITESLLMESKGVMVERLREIRKLGIRISIDDFGTGYSSLSYLKQLPIDTLKIDRSFVQDISSDEDSASIVKAIILLAHSLRLHVVAEGVETAEQLKYLDALGCDEFQGYLFAKPMSLNDLHDWLDQRQDLKADG